MILIHIVLHIVMTYFRDSTFCRLRRTNEVTVPALRYLEEGACDSGRRGIPVVSLQQHSSSNSMLVDRAHLLWNLVIEMSLGYW